MRLNKEDLVRITFDYKGKVNTISDYLKKDIFGLKSDLFGLKSDFFKLESDIHVTRNVNYKLSERLATVERRCHAKSEVWDILEEINVQIGPSLVEDCHRLASKGFPKKAIIKLNRSKDICRILLNKSQHRNLKPESVHLLGDESLHLYYKKLWSKWKRLWGAGHISAFWIRNGSLRIKLSNESVPVITHDCGLEKLFPGKTLIEGNYLLTDWF